MAGPTGGEILAAVGRGIGGPFGTVGQLYQDSWDKRARQDNFDRWGIPEQRGLMDGGRLDYQGLGLNMMRNNNDKGLPFLQQQQQHGNRMGQIGAQHGNAMTQIGQRFQNAQQLAGIQHTNAMAKQDDQQAFLQEQQWTSIQAAQMAEQRKLAVFPNRPLVGAEATYADEQSAAITNYMKVADEIDQVAAYLQEEGGYDMLNPARKGQYEGMMERLVSEVAVSKYGAGVSADEKASVARSMGLQDGLGSWTPKGLAQGLGAAHQTSYDLRTQAFNAANALERSGQERVSNRMIEMGQGFRSRLPEIFQSLDPRKNYTGLQISRMQEIKNREKAAAAKEATREKYENLLRPGK